MKKLLTAALAASIVLVPASFPAKAEGAYKELTYFEKKTLLTKVAREENIPPEILKAIAYNESQMQQFHNGDPNVSDDGGIGIMQVTPATLSEYEKAKLNIDSVKLVEDTEYNIKIGAAILEMKWNLAANKLPRVNNHNPRDLEHWYFALMAYNGAARNNDPNVNAKTYQTDIYGTLKKYATLDLYEFPKPGIGYDETGLKFNQMQQNWDYANTPSMTMLNAGDRVLTKGHASNLRMKLESSSGAKVIPINTTVEIIGGPFETPERDNLYAYYYVNVNGVKGYMATSNLKALSLPIAQENNTHTEPYGRLLLKGNTTIYAKSNGSFVKTSKTLTAKQSPNVTGIDNGFYQIGANQYILNDPKNYFVTGRLYVNENTPSYKLDVKDAVNVNRTLTPKENFKVFGADRNYYYIGLYSGYSHVALKKSHTAYSIGRVQPKRTTVPMYKPGTAAVQRMLSNKEILRVFNIMSDRYDLGGGYYVKKSDVNYLTY